MEVLREFESIADLFGLRGKVALVTGASTGLGAQFAKGLAVAGANVAVTARRAERLERVAEGLQATGAQILPVPYDLLAEDAPEHIFAAAEQALGPVDILVNNAGGCAIGPGRDALSREVEPGPGGEPAGCLPHGTARGPGHADARYRRAHHQYGYRRCAPSQPVLQDGQLHRGQGRRGGPHAAVGHGVGTGWDHGQLHLAGILPHGNQHRPALRRHAPRIQGAHPGTHANGSLGEPAEIVGALLYLASPAASFVTGTVLPVDGGWLA